MLTVFGDESHDETEQRVFAVAGIIGTQEEWDTLAPIWLNRTGGKSFHASECEADMGEYEGISHEENLNLYADLVKILAKTNLNGFGVIMDLKGYRDYFPDTVANIPYEICFYKVVMRFAEMAYRSDPQQKVKFTFDKNFKTNASTAVLFEILEKSNWGYAEYLDEISFANRSKTVGIQAADLLAREAMKYCDNILNGSIRRPVRKSIKALSETDKYSFDFLTRSYFEDYKNKFEKLQEKAGVTREDYRRWLLQNKLDDNIFNRNKFVLYLEDSEENPKKIFFSLP